ncbi:biliverdin-producing heme oxygenase [Acidiferrimicrobium sp. IK]|uniref:biliverdin-producing heme oxygenase n=1 Tax=Acidiferrimicrobium sp. IK TaxID=2871700 RepID=UPI0021CB1DC8|nr:biliverdin-producing heme oxygenase [Acidiferrimicrobium sp. IK]MCU4183616.1 biliverdin-producing heme oxygenase [Acidiferrimicrobium sp. IK]
MRSGDPGGLRSRLHAATRELHRRLDLTVEGAAPLSSPAGYAAFLTAQQHARVALQGRFGGLAPDAAWAARMDAHGAALLGDLRELRAGAVDLPAASVAPDASAGWGVVYVLEGSTLGGPVLRRRVAAALGPRVPVRFLSLGDGSIRRLGVDLEACRDPESAVAAAVGAFEVFLAVFGATFSNGRPDP